MKIEIVKLSQVKVNTENPRTITSDKFSKLITSLLVLPKMLEIRPVVVDNKMAALGGNMRLNALKEIAKMSIEAIESRLQASNDFVRKTQGEKETLLNYWKLWVGSPTAHIIKASELSEEERKQFMIKDNVAFGSWDYDALANKWDNKSLGDWGMDVWNPVQPQFQQPTPPQPSYEPTAPDASEDDSGLPFDSSALPDELQGVDLTPAQLPRIEGDDQTAMERIIIVYPKERAQELAMLVGLPAIEKVVYRIDEIIPSETE